MFFQSLNGFEHKLKEKDLIKGKGMAQGILSQMKQGINERRRNFFCNSCEYNLFCELDKLNLRIGDI